jgi:serine protease AprX
VAYCGITFRVKAAGVLATAAQVDALARTRRFAQLLNNKPLEYYNFDDTHLTGVKLGRLADGSHNNGTPVSRSAQAFLSTTAA